MKYNLKLYLILLITVFASIVVGAKTITFKHSFPYVNDFLSKQGSWLFWPLANFDGVHYLLLAKEGYVRDLYQAFFPLYPLLIRLFSRLTGSLLFSGLVISHISFLVCLYYFNKLLKLDFPKKTVKKILLLLVFFPTSYYFLSVYSESLFLALVLAFFYYLRQKKFWLAAGLAGLASASRPMGALLILPFWIEAINGFKLDKVKNNFLKIFGGSVLAVSGLLLYARFLFDRYSDPLKFIHVQSAFGASRTPDKMVLLYQVFYRYFKMFLTVDKTNPIFFTINVEFWLSLLFLILLLVAFFNKKAKIRLSYAVFSFLAYIVPTLTGTLSSMPRYVLVCFVGFMVLGQIKNTILFRIVLGLSIACLIVCATLFYRGYWIA